MSGGVGVCVHTDVLVCRKNEADVDASMNLVSCIHVETISVCIKVAYGFCVFMHVCVEFVYLCIIRPSVYNDFVRLEALER